jgi:hypothetical protein
MGSQRVPKWSQSDPESLPGRSRGRLGASLQKNFEKATRKAAKKVSKWSQNGTKIASKIASKIVSLFSSNLGRFLKPKWFQNGYQNEQRGKKTFNETLLSKKLRFLKKCILASTGAPQITNTSSENHRKFNKHLRKKQHFQVKPLSCDCSPIWLPKSSRFRSQIVPKSIENRIKNDIKFQSGFSSISERLPPKIPQLLVPIFSPGFPSPLHPPTFDKRTQRNSYHAESMLSVILYFCQLLQLL